MALSNLTKLTLTDIKAALINAGYSGDDITHATFENALPLSDNAGRRCGTHFRYTIVYPDGINSAAQGNVYVFVDDAGQIVAEF